MTHLDLMHGYDRRSSDRCRGWLVQEKFNGVRALWNGSEFVSREGNTFPAPDWFKAGLPVTPLDGELFVDRKTSPAKVAALAFTGDFSRIQFVIFDSPLTAGGYETRHSAARDCVNGLGVHLWVAPVSRLETLAFLSVGLAELKSAGGEGFMLRDPHAPYVAGRTRKMVKFKRAKVTYD